VRERNPGDAIKLSMFNANMRNGNTFGGDAQYGVVGPDTLGAFAGPVRPNPNC